MRYTIMTKNIIDYLNTRILPIPKNSGINGMYIGKNIGSVVDQIWGSLTGIKYCNDIAESFGTVTGFSIGLMASIVIIPIELLDDTLQYFHITNFDITESTHDQLIGKSHNDNEEL